MAVILVRLWVVKLGSEACTVVEVYCMYVRWCVMVMVNVELW